MQGCPWTRPAGIIGIGPPSLDGSPATLMRSTARPILFLALPLLFCACDNVARAWDPGYTPGGGNPNASTIELVPVGGDVRDARPTVKNTWPKGGGWPTTVPVVVEFSESVSQASVAPTSTGGTDGTVILRLKGTQQALPAFYDFLLGGRVLILRPATALSNAAGAAFEVVLLPGARDVDGVTFQVTTEQILAEFQPDQDTSVVNGQIVTVLPRDNQTDAIRESDYFVVFDRPAVANTVTSSSLQLSPSGGSPLAGAIATPLRIANQADPRVVRFRPSAIFAGGTQHELVVDDTIAFGTSG